MFKQIKNHKFISGILFLIIIASCYFCYAKFFKAKDVVRYATAQVQKGDLIVSISGSGQVSAFNQIDIKPKVSGDIVYVGAKNEQELKAGTLLFQIDSKNAEKAVRDAEVSLETAKLELEELLSPTDELTLLQAEHSLAQTKELKQKAEDNIIEAYEDVFNTISNAFLDLPTTITGIRDILYSYEIGESELTVSDYNLNDLSKSFYWRRQIYSRTVYCQR